MYNSSNAANFLNASALICLMFSSSALMLVREMYADSVPAPVSVINFCLLQLLGSVLLNVGHWYVT